MVVSRTAPAPRHEFDRHLPKQYAVLGARQNLKSSLLSANILLVAAVDQNVVSIAVMPIIAVGQWAGSLWPRFPCMRRSGFD